jgi:hypothetical protein
LELASSKSAWVEEIEQEEQVEMGIQMELQMLGWEECELLSHNDEKQIENQT